MKRAEKPARLRKPSAVSRTRGGLFPITTRSSLIFLSLHLFALKLLAGENDCYSGYFSLVVFDERDLGSDRRHGESRFGLRDQFFFGLAGGLCKQLVAFSDDSDDA